MYFLDLSAFCGCIPASLFADALSRRVASKSWRTKVSSAGLRATILISTSQSSLVPLHLSWVERFKPVRMVER